MNIDPKIALRLQFLVRVVGKECKHLVTTDTEQLLRLVQSISSPKAEPFKQWLAQVGYERIEETEDPERALNCAMETYLKKGEYKQANRRALTCQGSLQ